jgi:hypothetical protein
MEAGKMFDVTACDPTGVRKAAKRSEVVFLAEQKTI